MVAACTLAMMQMTLLIFSFQGHFLLTNLLLEDLKKAGGDGGDSRIVMVVSGHHDPDSMKRKSST